MVWLDSFKQRKGSAGGSLWINGWTDGTDEACPLLYPLSTPYHSTFSHLPLYSRCKFIIHQNALTFTPPECSVS